MREKLERRERKLLLYRHDILSRFSRLASLSRTPLTVYRSLLTDVPWIFPVRIQGFALFCHY